MKIYDVWSSDGRYDWNAFVKANNRSEARKRMKRAVPYGRVESISVAKFTGEAWRDLMILRFKQSRKRIDVYSEGT